MQISLGGCCIYDFDQQRAFEARYIAKNLLASWKHRKHNKNNKEHGDNTMEKNQRRARLPVGSLK